MRKPHKLGEAVWAAGAMSILEESGIILAFPLVGGDLVAHRHSEILGSL